MSAPYWGTLPKTSSTTAPRLSDDNYDPPADSRDSYDYPMEASSSHSQPKSQQQQQQQQQQRASIQTARTTNTDPATESTMSPFVSPTTSSFAGQGLAPRPPSFPYNPSQHLDFAERRQRRRSQKSEDLDLPENVPTPPAAPDVPRAPPVSYRDPYVQALPGPPRTARHGTAPLEYPGDMGPDEYYYGDSQGNYPQRPRGGAAAPPATARQHQRRRSVSGTGVSNGGGRDATNQPSRAASGRSKVSADVRSPLQRLEVKLDNISKEEKRARVEAAERRAREKEAAAAGANPELLQPGTAPQETPRRQHQQQPPPPQPQPQHTQQQVRFTERRASEDHPRQHTAVSGHRGPLTQHPPNDDPRHGTEAHQQTLAPTDYPEPDSSAGVPKRNLSFRQRAVQDDLYLPSVKDDSGKRAQAVHRADTYATAPPKSSGFALTRSGSNKLRKEPPGDPWYSRRVEMEQKYGHADARGSSRDESAAPMATAAAIPPSIPTVARDKPLPPEPSDSYEREWDTVEGDDMYPQLPQRGQVPSKAAKIMGFDTVQRRATAPTSRDRTRDDGQEPQQRQAPPRVSFGPVGVISGANDRGYHSDHAGDLSRGKTGHNDPHNGVFRRPQYLDEWKKGTVGLLGGSLLDLSEEQAPAFDKDTPWWEGGGSNRRPSINSRPRRAEAFDGEYNDTGGEFDDEMNILRQSLTFSSAPTMFKPPLYLKCGPLLRYRGMRHEESTAAGSTRGASPLDREIWRGSVMIVTRDSDSSYEVAPTLRLFAQPLELLPAPPHEISGEQVLQPEHVDPIAGIPKLGRRGETLYVRPVEHLDEARDISRDETDAGLFERTRSPTDYPLPKGAREAPGSYSGRHKRAEVDGEKVSKYKEVRGFRLHTERGHTFWRFNIEVELRDQQQRIAYRINKGPSMGFWVPGRGQSMNIMFHSCNGFSMGVNTDNFSGPDPMWRDVLNNHQTRPFHVMIGGGDQVYNDCLIGESKMFDEWLNIRDPMQKRSAQFTPAMQEELEQLYLERYCMWFSQGLFGLANSQIPMVNMWDDHDISDGYGSYPHSDQNCPVFCGLGAVAFKYYMLFQHQSVPAETEDDEPSWLLSQKPGPYVKELSRSLFMSLGSKMALLAVDARTERTEHDVISSDTWKLVMDRCYDEIKRGTTEHLLVLLGVPIAYPRLVWLESILSSRLMNPVKAMGKLGMLGNAFNRLDGSAEVMDDLNDHWTAQNHKKERSIVIEDLQDLAADKSVRVTILSGDVHLAAVGQFYANPKLGLPKHKDFRYMPNVISSAIANTPPPNILADTLNKRDKVHHFDDQTDESMIPLFSRGVDGRPRNNTHLLPHRNWCAIREWSPGSTPPPTPPLTPDEGSPSPPPTRRGEGGVGLVRRLTGSRAPEQRPEASRGRDSRPPLSTTGRIGGFIRRLSSRGRKPNNSSRQEQAPARTMSLTRGDLNPRNLFGSRRGSESTVRADDGGINGQWGDSDTGEEEYFDAYDEPRGPPSPSRPRGLSLRGGSGRPPSHAYDEFTPGDEEHFTTRPQARPQQQQGIPDDADEPPIKPFHRTPTGLSTKQIKKGGGAAALEVDLRGGLDVVLNVEVNPRDPTGITVPYRLLVPRLFWDDAKDSVALEQPEPSGFKKLFSFRKKQQQQQQPQEAPSSVPASEEHVGSGWGPGPGTRTGPPSGRPGSAHMSQARPPPQQQWQQRFPPAQQQPQSPPLPQPMMTRAGVPQQPGSHRHHPPPPHHYSARAQQQQQQERDATERAPPANRGDGFYDDYDDYDSAEEDFDDGGRYGPYGR